MNGREIFRACFFGDFCICVRDGSPKGREGRPCLALGPLGGGTVG